MYFYQKVWLWFTGFALVYCVGVNERENLKSGMEMFQSNIYYYVRINMYILHAQDVCACTRFLRMHNTLCMHNTLVHALQGPGTKAGAQKKVRPGAAVFFLVPALDPWPLQCMHKSFVHAQRVLCMHMNLAHAQESCVYNRQYNRQYNKKQMF